MTELDKRRNGLFTCLDCTKAKSKECFGCKNWHLFDLDVELSSLPYSEKSERYAKKQ